MIDPKPYLLGEKSIPQYNSGTIQNNNSASTNYKVVSKVKFTGIFYRVSASNGTG